MDNLLARLEKLTDEVVNRLAEITYEELTQFVEERERLISEIQRAGNLIAETTEEQRTGYLQKASRILSHDEVILNKMERLKNEAGVELAKFNSARKGKAVYHTDYIPDSAFFDRKK